MKPSVLYISYDGMLEPLGQSQVLSYLEPLAAEYDVDLISFEKAADQRKAAKLRELTARVDAAGITWHPMRYHKRPTVPATSFDMLSGALRAISIARRKRTAIVHARSYVAAMMALAVKRATGARFLFDIRGFWADERVDGGMWPSQGRLYRTAKAIERRLFAAADHVVTLTHASAAEIRNFVWLSEAPPISVIPTCANLELFSPTARAPGRPFTFGHVGSIGTWYLFDETLAFFRSLTRHMEDARMLVVNREEQDQVRARAERAGIPMERMDITAGDHSEMPTMIGRMDAGAAIIKPVYSKLASAPTKLAEYLGCGVPCVGNVGVGDMEDILEGRRVGVALSGFAQADLEAGAERLLRLLRDPQLAERCRSSAQDLFSLEAGVVAYEKAWRRLLAP